MMNTSTDPTPKEAAKLLELTGSPPYRRDDIEAAYLNAMRKWTGKVNNAILDGEKERARAIRNLVRAAKPVLLNAPAGTPTSKRRSATYVRPRAWRTATSVSLRGLFGNLGQAFLHQAWVFRDLFRSLISLPGSCVEIRDILRDVWSELQVVGIPKAVVVLFLLLGFLFLVNSCSGLIRAIVR